jgi:ABC-2 type transport system permease protein
MTTQSKSTVNQELILAARQGLVPAVGKGWLGGFSNLLAKELGEWFGTNRWIVQAAIWLLIINGLMAFILFVVPVIDPGSRLGPEENMGLGLGLFFNFTILFGAIGMIILAQDEIIQEKQTGTAAWILSKPVSRSAFVLTKLLSNLVGGLVFIAGLTGAVAYAEIYLVSQQFLPVLPYLMGIGIILLTLIFYLSLVIMLGTIFEQRGAVLGIAVGVLLGGLIASQFTPLVSYFLPVKMPDIALGLMQGQPLPGIAVSQLVTAGVWSILFTIMALWRFSRDEF